MRKTCGSSKTMDVGGKNARPQKNPQQPETVTWDLLPLEVRQHVLEARDREDEKDREKDRRERWKPIHEELSCLPRCSQHGTVRPCYFCWVDLEANLIDSFIFFDIF